MEKEQFNNIRFEISNQTQQIINKKEAEKNGIDVDYEVALDEKYLLDPTDENDNQLQKAIDILKWQNNLSFFYYIIILKLETVL